MNAVSMHAFRRRALLPFRLAFTAFAFALFGLGGIVFGFFLTPWLKMAGGTPEEKKSLARRVVKTLVWALCQCCHLTRSRTH